MYGRAKIDAVDKAYLRYTFHAVQIVYTMYKIYIVG